MTPVARRLNWTPCKANIDARPVEDPITHYVIVRRDLPLGVLGAMLIHAAGESSPGDLGEATFAIALAVADEAALIRLFLRLSAQGVEITPVHEPDAPYNGQLMAIGVRPMLRSRVSRFLSDVPLLKDSRAGRPREDAIKVETVV